MKVYCPYCKKEVEYKIEKRDIKDFRGIEINTYENVAVCKECHQDLYVNEIEEKNNERIYELYREKAKIIKPQDIIDLREKYDISQRELTAILGFGKMTINRYERGGVPTKAQSDYIKLLIDNDDKFIEKVKEAHKNGRINDKTYEKIVSEELNVDITKEQIQEEQEIEEKLKGHFKNLTIKVDASLATQPLMNSFVKYFASLDDLKQLENYGFVLKAI